MPPKLSIIQQTANTWISDIMARQRAGRNITIIRLSRLGWTQEQIGKAVGMGQGRIAQIINITNRSKSGTIKVLLDHDIKIFPCPNITD